MAIEERVKRLAATVGRNRTFIRQLPPHYGGARFRASTEGSLKLLRSAEKFDPTLLPLARDLVAPGSVVWDVGANIGVFTFAAAGLAGPTGRVVAVDADTWCVTQLRRSAQLNDPRKVARVDVVPAGLSDRVGLAEFVIARRSRAVNHLASTAGSSFAEGVREMQMVPTLTLDVMAEDLPAPDVLKIDAEGAELMILAGGHDFFARCRPRIILEADDGNFASLREALADVRYDLPSPPDLGAQTTYTLVATPVPT